MKFFVIQNNVVRANIELVIDLLKKAEVVAGQTQLSLDLTLNPETGAFAASSTQYLPIVLELDCAAQTVALKERSSQTMVATESFEKIPRRIVSQSCSDIRIIYRMIQDLKDFADLQLSSAFQRTLLHDAWFAISRDEAEKMLLKLSEGSYLFRKDPFAGCLEELVLGAKKEAVRCYTLTYLDHSRQVRDLTIVHWKDHWMFYDDDPTLSGDYFRSFDELLDSMGGALKKPIISNRVHS